MANVANRGEAVTVLMTVDSTRKISLFSGGTKLADQTVGTAATSIPLTVATLRFGSTEPSGFAPGTFLLEQVSAWTAPLTDADALLVSEDLNYVTPPVDLPKPIVSIPATLLSVREGETLQIPVTKDGVGACTVQLRTIGDTAVTPSDYTGFQQLITFAENDTVINVPLVTIADADDEEQDERLRIELSLAGSTDCTLGNANGVIMITQPPRISLPTTATVKEGSVLTLTVTKAGTGACSLTWRTSADTATVVGSDYTGVSATTLSFTSAETSKTISVTTLTDAAVEVTEFFNVFLENPVNCKITTPSCRVSLLDANSPDTPSQTVVSKAVGFASSAEAGLGMQVYTVTNLNDSGAGSLRDGCLLGNRMIVFAVAGRIQLKANIVDPADSNKYLQYPLRIASNTTIAGETAPPPGITISHNEIALSAPARNIRVSHITLERGYENTGLYRGNGDCAKVGTGGSTVPSSGRLQAGSIHFSHCAFFWGGDETIQHWPWGNTDLANISYHDCIFTEPLWKPSAYDSTLLNHEKMYAPYNQSSHAYGMLLGYGTKRVDVQYCMFANMDMREPFIDHSTSTVLANNICLNTKYGATIQQNAVTDAAGKKIEPLPDNCNWQLTLRGYLMISGPNSGTGAYSGFRFNSYFIQQPANTRAFIDGLYSWKGGPSNSTYNIPKTTILYGSSSAGFGGVVGKPYWINSSGNQVAVEVTTPPIDVSPATVTMTAQEIYDRALLNLGPRPKEIRDLMAGKAGAVGNKNVRRAIQQLIDKTGRWVNHQNETEVGGYYAPARVDRTFTTTATFPDGTLIGTVPAQPQPATQASKDAMTAWLRKHLDRVQYD